VERRVRDGVAHPRESLGGLTLRVFLLALEVTGIQGVMRSDLGDSGVWFPPGEEAGGTMLGDGEGSLDINHILKY
jgi:hypothetical protein